MAPEMLKGHAYTEKVDVFSFGMVLFEIATVLLRVNATIERVDDGGINWTAFEERDVFPEDMPIAVRSLFTSSCSTNPAERPSFRTIVRQLSGVRRSFLPSPPPHLTPFRTLKLRLELNSSQGTPPAGNTPLGTTPPQGSSLLVPPQKKHSRRTSGSASTNSDSEPSPRAEGGLGFGVFFHEASKKISDELRAPQARRPSGKKKDKEKEKEKEKHPTTLTAPTSSSSLTGASPRRVSILDQPEELSRRSPSIGSDLHKTSAPDLHKTTSMGAEPIHKASSLGGDAVHKASSSGIDSVHKSSSSGVDSVPKSSSSCVDQVQKASSASDGVSSKPPVIKRSKSDEEDMKGKSARGKRSVSDPRKDNLMQ